MLLIVCIVLIKTARWCYIMGAILTVLLLLFSAINQYIVLLFSVSCFSNCYTKMFTEKNRRDIKKEQGTTR